MSDRQDSQVTGRPIIAAVLNVLHDWGYDEASPTEAEQILDAVDAIIREDEKHKADLAISFWALENDNLKAKLAAAEAVCGYREAELLTLKGPCSTAECRLHYAHDGTCDIVKPQ